MPSREGTAGLLSRSLSFDSFKKAFLPTQESSEFPQKSFGLLQVSWHNPQDVRSGLEASQLPSTSHSLSWFTSILKNGLPHILYHILLIITLLKKGFFPFIDEDSQRGLEPCPHTIVAVPEFEL